MPGFKSTGEWDGTQWEGMNITQAAAEKWMQMMGEGFFTVQLGAVSEASCISPKKACFWLFAEISVMV